MLLLYHRNDMPFHALQTLVVGSGAAGLNAAVSLRKAGCESIAVLTEDLLSGTSRNTGSDKQTYYKLTTCASAQDSVVQMANSLFAGGSMDGDLALAEAAGSLRAFYHLADIGVPFPFNRSGEYIGYKTDHDPVQRGTSAGPLTSKYMTDALEREAHHLGIPFYDGYQVVELLTYENRIRGLLALCTNGEEAGQLVLFAADSIVYATGGEAGLYHASVYPTSQMGGSGVALRAGVLAKNLTESQYGIASIRFRWNLSGTYQQVLPRYFSTNQDGSDEREFLHDGFPDSQKLLTGVFLKGYQWPFDPRKAFSFGSSLVDILVYQETVLRGRRVFMDFRRNPACMESADSCRFDLLQAEAMDYLRNSGALQSTPIERLAHMNPSAIELYLNHGIDLRNVPLEIAVCAQHNNGGLSANLWWESNLSHFFPVGEVNGSHGVYRPGGSALNAGQVGSLRAAQYIAHCCHEQPWSKELLVQHCADQLRMAADFGSNALQGKGASLCLAEERLELGQRMSEFGAHIRSLQGVEKALSSLAKQEARLAGGSVATVEALPGFYRLRDLLVSQRLYLEAIRNYILHGGKSRGSYLISDPQGEKPSEALHDLFRFRLDGDAHAGQIQEALYTPEGCRFHWRAVRPIPTEEYWFENVWRACTNGQIYQ